MTNFSYDNSVPASQNNPSTDQPVMLNNCISSGNIWEADHIGFNASNGGTHKQVSFYSKNTPSAPVTDTGILYTADGSASATPAILKFRNSSAIFPVSAIRAYAYFTVGAGPGYAITLVNSFNVSTVVRASAGVYNITLDANVVGSANFGVIASSGILTSAYCTGSGTLTISTSTQILSFGQYIIEPFDAGQISFQVIQL